MNVAPWKYCTIVKKQKNCRQKFAIIKYQCFLSRKFANARSALALRDIWRSPLARQLLPPCPMSSIVVDPSIPFLLFSNKCFSIHLSNAPLLRLLKIGWVVIFRHASVSSTYPCPSVSWLVTLSDFQSLVALNEKWTSTPLHFPPTPLHFCTFHFCTFALLPFCTFALLHFCTFALSKC